MRRLSNTSLEKLGEGRFVDFLKENYVPKLSSVISFERFDYWLQDSESISYTGTLFYSKFKKSIYSEISEIRSRYNADDLNDYELKLIVTVLLNSSLLHFDDARGLHYNSESLNDLIIKTFNRNQDVNLVERINTKLVEIEN